MSALTKILIVLLTLSSIFLCGIVVTYVANADDYKQQYKNLKSEKDSLNENVKSLKKQVNEKTSAKRRAEDKLNTRISSLKSEIKDIKANLDSAEREKSLLLRNRLSFS